MHFNYLAVLMKECRHSRNGLPWLTSGLCYSHLCRPRQPLLEHINSNTTEWKWPVLKQKWPALSIGQCSKALFVNTAFGSNIHQRACWRCEKSKFSWGRTPRPPPISGDIPLELHPRAAGCVRTGHHGVRTFMSLQDLRSHSFSIQKLKSWDALKLVIPFSLFPGWSVFLPLITANVFSFEQKNV